MSRVSGPSGWSSALAGEAVGTFAAIALAFGWTTVGPALVSVASEARRGRIYREALIVRSLTALIALPITAVISASLASEEYVLLAVLMGLQGALISLSYTWFAVGLGDPWSIALYDAVPRVIAAVCVAAAIGLLGAPVELYPLSGIAVTVIGTTLYTVRILRRFPAAWPARREVPGLFRITAPVAVNEGALGLYSSVPVPLVQVAAPAEAAGYASGDKMLKLGQFLPITLANALQYWTAEVSGEARAQRLRRALGLHIAMGLLGWAALGSLGSFVSLVLFGESTVAPVGVVVVLGFAFACYSTRMSMIRHFLFPAHAATTVMVATLVASAVGLPLMIALTYAIGPVGTAIGYGATELIATVWMIRRTRRAYRELVAAPAATDVPARGFIDPDDRIVP